MNKKKKVDEAISAHYRKLGKASAEARAKKILEAAREAQTVNKFLVDKAGRKKRKTVIHS